LGIAASHETLLAMTIRGFFNTLPEAFRFLLQTATFMQF